MTNVSNHKDEACYNSRTTAYKLIQYTYSIPTHPLNVFMQMRQGPSDLPLVSRVELCSRDPVFKGPLFQHLFSCARRWKLKQN